MHVEKLSCNQNFTTPQTRKFRIDDSCKNAYDKNMVGSFIKDSLIAFKTANLDNSPSEEILFIFDERKILEEFRILDIFQRQCQVLKYEEFYECLLGKNCKFKVSFSFKKTVFEKYASFNHLVCKSIDFSNTSFKKGAILGQIRVDEVIYMPWELGADVRFESDDNRAEIKNFKFRHNLEGNGWTYFIDVDFKEKADFRNAVLNKVHFGNVDMGNCHFANSIIQDTRFLNCNFPSKKNIWIPHPENRFIHILFLCLIPIAFFYIIFAFKDEDSFYLLLPFLSFLLIFLLNPLFMFTNTINPFAKHLGTADEDSVWVEKEQKQLSKKIAILTEVYRQLRTNLEKNNDFQQAGEFYFSQRYAGVVYIDFVDSTKLALQQFLIGAFHWINGFGERWLRALIWPLLTIFIFTFIFEPDKDFVSTKDTPSFLLAPASDDNKTFKYNKILQIQLGENESIKFSSSQNELFIEENNTTVARYTAKLKEDWRVDLAFSMSRLTAPFTTDEKKWFAIASEKGYIAGFLETILLWLFAFSFAVAIKNRIKR